MRKLFIAALLFVSVASTAAPVPKRILRVTNVRVTNDGARLTIEATGQASTPGWTELDLVPMQTSTKKELVYAFVGVPPNGIVTQQVAIVHARATFTGPRPKTVKIRALQNSRVASVPKRAKP
ncbi:MAG: hypothetical protein QOH21_3668 [Acidobacteriota bacterium]|jgi:hypothetical protein|nr:hypothetical protein [Acidobacteriota bacterium]